MDYNVTLLIFGILLLLTGLIGKIKAKELEIGTESRVIRVVVGLIGVGLVILSLILSPVRQLFTGGDSSGDGSSSSGEVTTVEVPDIVGDSVEAARSVLVARGLRLGSHTGTRQSEQVKPGSIASQRPSAGTQADRGSAVSFETAVAPLAPTLPSSSTIAEDCVRHDLGRLRAEQVGGRWKITEGDHWLLDFDSDSDSARRALEVLQFYRADRICYVERPNAPMMYILSGSTAPSQSLPGEDCIDFNAGSLAIRQEGSRFLLASSSSRMIMFPDRASAERAVAVIRKYGFTRQCFVGRPQPEFKYFRQ